MVDNLAVSDLSRVIPWMMLLRFEHSTLWVRVEQRNHSTMAAIAISYISQLILEHISQKHRNETNILR